MLAHVGVGRVHHDSPRRAEHSLTHGNTVAFFPVSRPRGIKRRHRPSGGGRRPGVCGMKEIVPLRSRRTDPRTSCCVWPSQPYKFNFGQREDVAEISKMPYHGDRNWTDRSRMELFSGCGFQPRAAQRVGKVSDFIDIKQRRSSPDSWGVHKPARKRVRRTIYNRPALVEVVTQLGRETPTVWAVRRPALQRAARRHPACMTSANDRGY